MDIATGNLSRILTAICIVAVTTLSGCIKNDIPFPRIQQNILALAAEGQISDARIDDSNLTATIVLGEDVDIRKVRFTEYDYTSGATSSVNLLEGEYDLTTPINVKLSRYQTYQWIIDARQDIERYFTVAGQVGATIIDVPAKRVVVTVPDHLNLHALEVTSVKLGPEGITTLVPDLKVPGVYDLSKPMHVEVNYFDITEDWTIFVIVTESVVTTTAVDAWSQVIWAYAEAPSDGDNGFEYRNATSSEWIKVPASAITTTGGSLKCCIPHLTPLTSYVVRAYSGKEYGNEITVTTQATRTLVDGSFDQWWLKNNKIWCPWDENGEQFWDTGNTGAATLGQSNVVPSDYTPDGTGKSAKLETKFVGIGPIGKLAAGSIYTGNFEKVDGTNGILAFGRPWTQRPTRLRGYYQYTTAPINYASTELKSILGQPDTCHIYIAMTDWDAPYQIRTNPNNRQLFDKNSDAVIAYGELKSGSSFDGWREFEITLNYRSTSRVPKYILITCAASYYGDYFTGGTGACLYVDQLSLDYDY